MPLLEDSIDTTKAMDLTFGTDPVLDGINKNDPLSSQTGNSGYGSQDELPTNNIVSNNLPETGVQDFGGSESGPLLEPSSSGEGGG